MKSAPAARSSRPPARAAAVARARAAAFARARAAGAARALAAAAFAFALAAPLAHADLAPYRALARSEAGARLLALARDEMRGAPAADDSLPDWPAAAVPLYVTLQSGRATRACVGRETPPRGTLADAVRALARDALVADRRRAPVRPEELDRLRVVLAFAGELVPLASPYDANPARDGLLVQSPRGAVAFLPGEARTIAWALAEARRLGVIERGNPDVSFRRFEVVTIAEPSRSAALEEE